MNLRTVLILVPLIVANRAMAMSEAQARSEVQRECRLQHAHELLGKYYKTSAAHYTENVRKINSAIFEYTKEHLPKSHRKEYRKVAQTIIDEALKFEFDPVFLLSVIQGESSFNPRMIGGVGEIGMMQIRPTTAKWIAGMYGFQFKGRQSLFDPVTNIKIGAAYLDYLRDKFDSHAQLYLAAYNMGQRAVANVVEKNIWPKDYPIHVMKKYVEFYEDLRKERRASSKS